MRKFARLLKRLFEVLDESNVWFEIQRNDFLKDFPGAQIEPIEPGRAAK